MFDYLNNMGGNGAEAYVCAACGALITLSDRLIHISGSTRHHFINPAGIPCDFQTFYACPGAAAAGQATEEHSWFPGYLWQFAFCKTCAAHLGWRYTARSSMIRPLDFWGVLVDAVQKAQHVHEHKV